MSTKHAVKHPIRMWDLRKPMREREKVMSEEAREKGHKHLLRHARFELATSNDRLIPAMTERYGDFQLYNPARKDLYRTGREVAAAAQYIPGALRSLWLESGDEKAREKYIIIIKHILSEIEAMSDAELLAKIDDRGTLNPWHAILKEACYQYAKLYDVSSEEKYARRTCLLLERFGEVVDHWQIHYKYWKNRPKPGSYTIGNEPIPLHIRDGLWDRWGFVHDLIRARGLPVSYSLVANSRSFRELGRERQKKIVDDLLHRLVKKHLLFPFQPGMNQSMSRTKSLIYFGMILGEPAYFHQAYRWLKDMMRMPYFRDGFWCEGTVSYGHPMTKGIIECAKLLDGYSDPPGYVDPEDGQHFDDLEVEKEFEGMFALIKRPYDLLALPNNRSAALEDTTWNGVNKFFDHPMKAITTPFLLGASGVGMMGFGKEEDQVRVFFHFDGTHGHSHYDCLGIFLWACGQEIASETCYRGAEGGVKGWNRSTAAHNTVVIDEKDQYHYNQGVFRREELQAQPIPLYPRYTYAHLRGAYSDNNGRLTLWDTVDTDVQVAEVDGVQAYRFTVPDVKVYRRTLMLVRMDEKHFYIIDIFRVKGGKTHDWMFHGNLEKVYKVKLSGTDAKMPALVKKEGTLGKYLNNLRIIPGWDKNVVAEFSAGDGATLRTIMAGAPGTEVILADGPAMRLDPEPRTKTTNTGKKSLFLCIRRSGPENVFVAVHEAYKDKPVVKDISLVDVKGPDTFAVGLRVILDGREDLVLSTTQEAPYQPHMVDDYSTVFSGKLLHAVMKNGKPDKVDIFGAGSLAWGDLRLERPTGYSGRVVGIESRDRGDVRNSFCVEGNLPAGEVLSGSVIILHDGEKRPHPYTIATVEALDNDKSRVKTEEETGLVLTDDAMIMTFYPCWKIPGQVTYSIPGHAHFTMDSGGKWH